MDLLAVVNVVVRFAHVGAVICLIGALLWSHLDGRAMDRRNAGWLWLGVVLALVSGGFQFAAHVRGASGTWHLVAGLKLVLALHVLCVTVLLSRGVLEEEKRVRLTRGALYSGWTVVLLGVILHTLK